MRRISTLVLALCLALPVLAKPTPEGAAELVRETTDRMLAALEREKRVIREQPARIYDLVSDIVLPHFDFEAMARSVLGKYWRQASPEQRRRFTEEFRTLLVRTYASSLAEYSGQEVKFLPPRPGSTDDEARVRTEIEQQGGFPIPVEYDLRYQDDGWKVVGVTIDGLDLVLNYRRSFGQEIRQQGLAAVIDNLAARNRESRS